VIVAHLRNDPALTARFRAASALYVPWIVLGELHYGACRSRRRELELALISQFLESATLLAADRLTAILYGELKAELAAVGKPIPENDIWIAAVARQFDLPLATRDAHFSVVPRLLTLAW
jgi:tRNA(fMet)-specific endonuclease VapC